MRLYRLLSVSALCVPLLAQANTPPPEAVEAAPRCDAVSAKPVGRLESTRIARGFNYPWGLAFLPDGRMLVTERVGQLRLVSPSGEVSPPLEGVPEVAARGQGGMLDVLADPDFATNSRIYLSYAETGRAGTGTTIASARLDLENHSLADHKVLLRQTPKSGGNGHFGSRLAFGADGKLLATLGDRQKSDPAQDPKQTLGKIVRLNPDGSIPADNPFVGQRNWLPEIFTLGHRNPQGMILEPGSDRVWISEHGARGGDEINLLTAGANYGWPVITYGTHYNGEPIGLGHAHEGMEQPVCFWNPSIAPGNIAFYDHERSPEWRGNLFVASLKDKALHRLILKDGTVTATERIPLGKRVRDVRVGPDGWLYLLTDDSDGKLIRLGLRS